MQHENNLGHCDVQVLFQHCVADFTQAYCISESVLHVKNDGKQAK